MTRTRSTTLALADVAILAILGLAVIAGSRGHVRSAAGDSAKAPVVAVASDSR